jgi:hypothetical protein
VHETQDNGAASAALSEWRVVDGSDAQALGTVTAERDGHRIYVRADGDLVDVVDEIEIVRRSGTMAAAEAVCVDELGSAVHAGALRLWTRRHGGPGLDPIEPIFRGDEIVMAGLAQLTVHEAEELAAHEIVLAVSGLDRPAQVARVVELAREQTEAIDVERARARRAKERSRTRERRGRPRDDRAVDRPALWVEVPEVPGARLDVARIAEACVQEAGEAGAGGQLVRPTRGGPAYALASEGMNRLPAKRVAALALHELGLTDTEIGRALAPLGSGETDWRQVRRWRSQADRG